LAVSASIAHIAFVVHAKHRSLLALLHRASSLDFYCRINSIIDIRKGLSRKIRPTQHLQVEQRMSLLPWRDPAKNNRHKGNLDAEDTCRAYSLMWPALPLRIGTVRTPGAANGPADIYAEDFSDLCAGILTTLLHRN
jgi:hypothetical protein